MARSFPVQKGDARVRAGEHISVGLGSRGKRKERVRELETSKSKGREGDADAPVRVVARMADTFPSASIRPSLEVRYHMPFNYRYALTVFNPKKLRYFCSQNLALEDKLFCSDQPKRDFAASAESEASAEPVAEASAKYRSFG